MPSKSDQYIYETSIMNDITPEKFTKKEMAFVLDNNSSSYSGGQVNIDTSSAANSGKWQAYSESYLSIPIIYALQSAADVTTHISPFTVVPKSGFWHFIDSISIQYNNVTVVQQTTYNNVYVSYKVQTQFSLDDQTKFGASIGFWMDSPTSFQYSAAAASADGNGVSNNRTFPTYSTQASVNYIPEEWNNGLLQRARFYSFPRSTAANAGSGVPPQAAFNSTPQSTAMANFDNNGGAGAARIYYWSVIAIIRMKDLSDFFEKIPLTRGVQLTAQITLNTLTSCTVATVAAGPTMNIAAAGLNVFGRTCPVVVTSSLASNPSNIIVANSAGSAFTVAAGVGSVTIGGTTVSNNISPSGIRWWIPTYTLVAAFEQQLLQLHPTTTIEYTDIFNFNYQGITNTTTFTNLLTNGLTNIKELVVVPLLNSGVAGNNAGGAVMSEILSPFSSSPATTAPEAAIQNFQVTISSINAFMQQEQYDYNAFLDEFAKTGINGGNSTGLTSGLISQFAWEHAYRYYVCNLARRLPADDGVPKSVQIQGTIGGGRTLDLCCFITVGKSITIETGTGALIE